MPCCAFALFVTGLTQTDLHPSIHRSIHPNGQQDRDITIGDKEKKIYELKKKNQELEKFKFVLDYKIKELNRQIEPRECEWWRSIDGGTTAISRMTRFSVFETTPHPLSTYNVSMQARSWTAETRSQRWTTS